jgi:flagellar basal-body rod protein FlgB
MEIFENTLWAKMVKAVHRAMDAATLRHRVYAHNLANVNTPGYKRKDVLFEQLLKEEKARLKARRTHPLHLHFKVELFERAPIVVQERATIYRNDENNVDPEYEMVQITKNSLLYNALSLRIGAEFRHIRDIIRRGGAI